MIKNFGKFKQWTGERLGGAKATLQTEDFQQLDAETETRRAGFEKIQEAADLYHVQLSKKKPSLEDNKTKCSPIDILGRSWVKHGKAFPEESNLRVALTCLGLAEGEISSLQDDFADVLKQEYGSTLTEGQREYKEYQNLGKKLESRRLDYDANLNRLQKSKKEKPELEQALQSSRTKYEETEYDLIKKMEELQSYEEEQHLGSLKRLLDAQISYYTKATELLVHVRSKWDSELTALPSVSLPGSDHRAPVTRQLSQRQMSSSSLQTPKRAPSHASLQSFQGSSSLSALSQPSAASVPRRPSLMQRRALYDFTGTNDDELSFCKGDIITVSDCEDEGWWTGSLRGQTGIFPVIYTEEYKGDAGPVPSLTAISIPTTPAARTQTMTEASPFDDVPTQEGSQGVSLARNHTQTPPPPFSDRRAASTAPATPQAFANHSDYFQGANSQGKCQECGCEEYKCNLFKKDQCSNCFHKH